MKLKGCVLGIGKLTDRDIKEMGELMAEFYDNINIEVFLQDLYDKEYCLILRDREGSIKGFSTQKIINFILDGQEIFGIFSGDTIIHKNYWGSPELFKVFVNFFFDMGQRYENFYWFLVVKGYKTYKILPTFFQEFYPNCREETPPLMQRIMDSFGENFYPDVYNKNSGVLEYKKIKDRLKEGVADITAKKLADRDIHFFCEKNPNYLQGNDMVCITKLNEANLRDKVKPHLLRGTES